MNEVTINDIMLVKNDLSSVVRFVDLFNPNDIFLTVPSCYRLPGL